MRTTTTTTTTATKRDNATKHSRQTFSLSLNDRMGTMMEEEDKKSDGQAGFGPNRSCVDHVYTLGNTGIILGRKDAGLRTYCIFGDVQKVYNTE